MLDPLHDKWGGGYTVTIDNNNSRCSLHAVTNAVPEGGDVALTGLLRGNPN
jgi:hypothetical protein